MFHNLLNKCTTVLYVFFLRLVVFAVIMNAFLQIDFLLLWNSFLSVHSLGGHPWVKGYDHLDSPALCLHIAFKRIIIV
jgi:hypothetical protein